MANLGNMGFTFLALGRFDDKQFYLGIPLNGESAIYWTGAVALLIVVLFIALGIKGTNPKSDVRGEKFSMHSFLTSILNKNLFPVYFLIFGSAMMNAGLGTMAALLYTDQWQFTKQEMGNNNLVGGVINMFLPLTMSLLGGMGAVIAGLLLYHARRPMPVPYVPGPEGPGLAPSGGPLPESLAAA